MDPKRPKTIICILALSLCLSACGPGQAFGPKLGSTPATTLTPTATFTTPATAMATQIPAPIPAVGRAIGGGKFDGLWTAAFTLQINTRLLQINQRWYTFLFDLQQQGNNVTGTITSFDKSVSGTLQGTVDKAGVFHGTMRLSWDTHDWETLSMRIFPDGAYGVGTAIFPAALNEYHFYTIELLPAR